jgi:hypothetical protein
MCPRRLADKLGGPHPIDVSGREPVQEAEHISVNHLPIKTSERSAKKVERLSTVYTSNLRILFVVVRKSCLKGLSQN